MQLTITSFKDNKSGQKEGKFGSFTWYSCGAQFAEHGDKWFNGFIKDYELKKFGVQYPSEMKGKTVEVTLSQEEYNGKMQDKFQIEVPKLAKGSPNVSEMAIKMHIDQKFAALQEDLRKIAEHLGMEQVKPKTPEEPTYPEYEGEPKF